MLKFQRLSVSWKTVNFFKNNKKAEFLSKSAATDSTPRLGGYVICDLNSLEIEPWLEIARAFVLEFKMS